MFRFYRITTWPSGETWVDFNGLCDWQDVKDEIKAGGQLEGRVEYADRPCYQDFVIYESA